MKRILCILLVLFLFGCASTLSLKGADGTTMVLSNYAVTEVYNVDGKLVQRIMVPDNSIFAGILEKLSGLWKSITDMTNSGLLRGR